MWHASQPFEHCIREISPTGIKFRKKNFMILQNKNVNLILYNIGQYNTWHILVLVLLRGKLKVETLDSLRLEGSGRLRPLPPSPQRRVGG